MVKKNILFINKISLDNPMRGTPLRIYNFLDQMSGEFNLYVSADDIDKKLNVEFFQFPNVNFLNKFLFFRRIIKDKKIDVVMSATGTGIKLLIMLKLLCSVKIAIDLHGLDFEEPYYHGRIKKSSMIKRELIFKFYLRFYDLVFVVSKKLKNYFASVNKNIVVIYGGVNLEEFKLPSYTNRDYLFIGYMGNARSYQGLDLLLETAKNIKLKNLFPFKLNLIISGDEKEVRDIISQYGLDENINLSCNVDHHKVDSIINHSDVLVLVRPGGIKMTEYAYPAKLPEYLATGIVNIITNVGPVEELLKNTGTCIIIGTDNIVSDLETNLWNVFKMSHYDRQIIGQTARDFVSHNLTWDILGKKINKYLGELK